MVNIILVQFLVLLFGLNLSAKVDRVHQESYLGEKRLDSYSDRYQPLIFQDIYQGKMTFEDEVFFQSFFDPYLFEKEKDFSFFLRSELNGGLSCSNELLSKHFDEIRYSYRLITLSYLIEGQWHMNLMSKHLRLKKGCDFDLKSWANTCKPKTKEMKTFTQRLLKYSPRYDEVISNDYKKANWWKEFREKDFKFYSHYRVNTVCKDKCEEGALPGVYRKSCEEDQKLMTLICSEMDDIYGLSENRDAYYLLGQSNIINTYNKHGEALGCLRRFSEVMSHKEVKYEVLNQLFPMLQSYLRQRYQERFLQGRVFFFGSGKEFEEKGLADIYVKEQPFKVESLPKEPEVKPLPKLEPKAPAPAPKVAVKKEVPRAPAPVKEIKKPIKSAFLQAAELRSTGHLDRAEVDMLKLKYDYIFSLNQINTLSFRLKTFMTREALLEMMSYDKLGTKEGAVPLLFIKFMIDMQEHQGLWNMISVLGNRFYVSNDLDTDYPTEPELIQLTNDESTGRQWQLYILKP